jgi:hypothetical protein
MKAHGAWLLFLLAFGCSSSHPLADADGALGPGGAAVGGTGGALGPSGAAGGATTDEADAGAAHGPSGTADGAPADCGPPMETAPCRTDSDCRSAYLVCVPPDYVTVTICRDPNASPDPSCPVFPELSAAPICPQTIRVTSTICEVRYQRPCTVDSDCGPAGYMCVSGGCRQTLSGAACNSASDCPTEWDCYAPCACPGSGVSAKTVCVPPFAQFGCPECPAVTSDGG